MVYLIMEDVRYPIGEYVYDEAGSVEAWKNEIKALPASLKKAVDGLADEQLDTPYRDGGWTVRQVVHHVGDSHLNMVMRVKLALTEENPTIIAYNEVEWAKLGDTKVAIKSSLNFIEALHVRIGILLDTLSEEDLSKTFVNPESGPFTIKKAISQYAWHGKHHVADITSLRQRNNW